MSAGPQLPELPAIPRIPNITVPHSQYNYSNRWLLKHPKATSMVVETRVGLPKWGWGHNSDNSACRGTVLRRLGVYGIIRLFWKIWVFSLAHLASLENSSSHDLGVSKNQRPE